MDIRHILVGVCIYIWILFDCHVDSDNNCNRCNNIKTKGEYKSMTLQQVIDELKNIKEQASNDEEIGKESILDAITDIIHDTEGVEFNFSYNDDDHYASFEETDFSSLADMD